MKKVLVVIFGVFAISDAFSFSFDFKETNMVFVSKIIGDAYKNVLITNLIVNSSYIESFLKENYKIDKFSAFMVVSNNSLYVNVVASNTNFFIKRFPVPFVEGLEVFFFINSKDFLTNFKKAGVLDYGGIKLIRLYYSDVASIILYISQEGIVRVDYILSQGNNEIMLWSYLCAYSKSKIGGKSYLSGILFNLEAREFYKFDFVPY